jgi:hypothetical protein
MNIFKATESKWSEIKKSPRKFIWIITMTFACAFFIFCTQPSKIQVSTNLISFDLHSFKDCSINFNSPVKISSVGISKIDDGIANSAIKTTVVKREFQNFYFKNDYANSGPTQLNHTGLYRVQIFLPTKVPCEIESVFVDGAEVNLKDFLKNHLKTMGAKYVTVRYIRDDLLKIIVNLNDAISNVILTLLFFGISVLGAYLARLEFYNFCYSDEVFKNHLEKILNTKLTNDSQRTAAWELYFADWYVLNNRLRFFQVFGPAIGFILTVSSLIASLAPAAREMHDESLFLTGIHVAMISTFLGLLLRILALESARVNDALLVRAELILKS